MQFVQNAWQKTKKNKDATMQRRFYTKHNNNFVSKCNCYLESHLCPALQGFKYDAQYDRSTDTESIYVQKQDFQKPSFFKYYCHNKPFTQTQFFSYVGVYGTRCHKQILNNKPENIQECVMINKLHEHNIPIQFVFRSWSWPILGADIMDVVEVWIKTDRLDRMYLFDGYGVLGTCADCRWHESWHEHDCAPEQDISCTDCPVSTPDKCPAKQMLRNGYTECESKIKCMSLLHAQSLKEKFKDGHTK